MRREKTKSLQEDIVALSKISLKEKRLEQAETVHKYELCEMIHSEIQDVKATKRTLQHELSAFKEEKKAVWYQKRKQARLAESLASPGPGTSDDSDVFPLSSPSVPSSFDRSCSLSIESPPSFSSAFDRSSSLLTELPPSVSGSFDCSSSLTTELPRSVSSPFDRSCSLTTEPPLSVSGSFVCSHSLSIESPHLVFLVHSIIPNH